MGVVLEHDVLSQFAVEGRVVLAAQEGVAEGRIVGELLVDGLVVGELHIVLHQLGAGVLIVDELVHDVPDHGGVIGTGSGQQPGAAPEVGLRTLADGPVAGAALFGVLGVAHGEVVVPGGAEEAHGLAVGKHLSSAFVGPDVAGLGVALVGEVFGLLHPFLDGGGHLQVLVGVHPGLRHVVGEHPVGGGFGSGHVIALFLGLGGDFIELGPVGQGLLDFCGVVGAQHVLGDGPAVDEGGGAALEGNALHDAALIGGTLDGVLVGVGEIGDAEGGHVLGAAGVGVLGDVVGFGQEQVDLVVVGSTGLSHQGLVQLFLISAAVTGGNDPVHGHTIGDLVILLEEALEFFVPCVDVENLSFGGGSGGGVRRLGVRCGGGGLGVRRFGGGSGAGIAGGRAGCQGKYHGQRQEQG